MIVLRIVFFAQLLVMLAGFLIFLLTPVGLHTVILTGYLLIIALAAILYALWQFIRHPTRRKWASAIAVTPFICLTTPFLIAELNGGPVEAGTLIALVFAFIVIACFMMLAKSRLRIVEGLFANKRLNMGILIALCVLLALYWTPIVAWLYNQEAWSQGNIGEQGNTLKVIGFFCFAAVAGSTLLLSLFMLLYAPVGLVRNAGGRLVHAGQLLVTLTTLASLATSAFVVFAMNFNPG